MFVVGFALKYNCCYGTVSLPARQAYNSLFLLEVFPHDDLYIMFSMLVVNQAVVEVSFTMLGN